MFLFCLINFILIVFYYESLQHFGNFVFVICDIKIKVDWIGFVYVSSVDKDIYPIIHCKTTLILSGCIL